MTSALNAKRANERQPSARKRRASMFRFALFAVAAIAVAGALIAVQAFGGGGGSVEPPVGQGRVLGNPDAPITIVEYADFQCPVCKRAAAGIIPVLEEEYVKSGQAKIEFRHFPFLGQESWDAAQAAAAAEEQGKFWEYYAALFNAQGAENSGAFSYDRLLSLAEDIGLDVERFDETLASNKNLELVRADADAARERGVSATPTFFINGAKIVGAQDLDTFRDAIDKALAEVEAEEAAP
jgi:protein-disulfide isomerase